MAKFYTELNDGLRRFIAKQKIFFTATAVAEGRVNLSPKGMDTFRCLDNKTVAYLNLTGSGNETAAHLRVNDRITIMFCSFEGGPLILRLYGRGRAIHPYDHDWKDYAGLFEDLTGARQVILARIDSVQTSCGYAVPEYRFVKHRQRLKEWTEKKGPDGIQQYWKDHNQVSIDGLPTGIFPPGKDT